ncbi:MAG: AMP-binding protein, partial [Acidobacteria bacterium]|nr:AMP-binding protein [Acidobacteriota bacterium]
MKSAGRKSKAAGPHDDLAGGPRRVLTPAAYQAIVVERNATADPPAGSWLVHRRFERQAADTPDAVALEGSGHSWTYAELDRRAERLAGRLRGLGAGPEIVVALLLPRSPAAAVAILG